jgi:fimbrial isopeptide formation D2 family protein/uncharacterized repeat protein (TIGR01451 family)
MLTETSSRAEFGFFPRFLTILLLLVLALSQLPPADVGWGRPLQAPVASTDLSLPDQALIGDTLTIQVSFDNTGPLGDTGFGPYIDLFLPRSGVDGLTPPATDDGISFTSAAYLGTPVLSQVQDCVADDSILHPLTGLTLTCPEPPAGMALPFTWELVTLTLPFGSFATDQPAAVVTVIAQMSSFADVNILLPVQASSGFHYGRDALDNPLTDPPILGSFVSASVEPVLLLLDKTYMGPEDETATGPNFPRQYVVTVDLPQDQTLTNLDITDRLPDNIQYKSFDSASPGDGSNLSTPSTTTPGGELTHRFPSVTGSTSASDATYTFSYFVPISDTLPALVLPIYSTCDDAISVDNALASGYWDALDPRDSDGLVSSDLTPSDHTLTDKCIAIQKGVSLQNDMGGAGATPGDTLQYSLDFQVSDFAALQNVLITDTLSDGQRFDATFTPLLSVNGNAYTLSEAGFDGINFTLDTSQIGNDANPMTDGSTTLIYRVSDEIQVRGADARLIGGCVPPAGGTAGPEPNCSDYNDGGTTGRIIYRTVIQDQFSDTYPSGDPSVDHGDVLANNVTIQGQVLTPVDLSPSGFTEADASGAGVAIQFGVLTKTIYAINENPTVPNPVRISPGDRVTYRLHYTLPSSDFEDLRLDDYLPLPIFDATELGLFTNTICGIPAAGAACLGPADTYHTLALAVTPTMSVDANNNRVSFSYGDYDNPSDPASVIDLLFTMTTTDDPFADGLYLTNQVRVSEGTTNAGSQQLDDIIQIQLTQPVLTIQKGVVASDQLGGVYDRNPSAPLSFSAPGGSCPRFIGVLDSPGLMVNPVAANLSSLDARDVATFAIVVENTGSGLTGAFDVQLSDVLPVGLSFPAGGANLCVTDGTGAPIAYTGDLFGSGLELTDPGPTNPPAGALDPGLDANGNPVTSGRNIAVITYDVQLPNDVPPQQSWINMAILSNYAGKEAGADHTLTDLSDTASLQAGSPALAKSLTGTNQTHTSGANVAIGELLNYTLTITVPEGRIPSMALVDTLDAGLGFVDCQTITASSGLSTDLMGGFDAACNDPLNPVITAGAGQAIFDLGTVTNTESDNDNPETIEIVYRTVALNNSANFRGATHNNQAVLTWQFQSAPAPQAAAANMTVVEPTLSVSKSASPSTGLDAGDSLVYDIMIQHSSASNADAFNVSLSDILPAGLVYVSHQHQAGLTPDSLSFTSGTLSAEWSSFPNGQTSTLRVNVTLADTVTPNQAILNTVDIAWSSLPGNVTTAQSDYNSVSTERTGNVGDPGGAENDYHTSANRHISTRNAALVKTLVTSELVEARNSATQVVIGELATYQLVVTLPEGEIPAAIIIDNLDGGLAFVDVTGFANSNETDVTGAGLVPPLTPVVTNNGGTITFNLGTITNANRNNLVAETLTITYRVVVLNVIGNQNTTQLNNSAVLSWTGGGLASVSAAVVTVIEPVLQVTKTALPNSNLDAGDQVVYTITVSHAAASNADAYEVSLTDVLNANLVHLSHQHLSGLAPASLDFSSGTLTATWDSFPDDGSTSVIELTVNVAGSANPGQTIPNRVDIVWTSMLGDQRTTPRSSYNSAAIERNGSGGVDDYARNVTTNVTTVAPTPNKLLVTTSESHTSGSQVAIGEIVRFRLEMRLAEGVNTNFRLRDLVPNGLTYLNGGVDGDQTTKVALVCDSGPDCLTSSTLNAPGLVVSGTEANLSSIIPTVTLPDSAVCSSNTAGSGGDCGTANDAYISSTDVYFRFGDLINTDRDSSFEYLIVEFNLLVDNSVIGGFDGNDAGETPGNTARAYINGTTQLGNDSAPPDIVTIVEPARSLAKSVHSAPNPSDSGGVIAYQVTYSNPIGANVTSAFDVSLVDALPASLTLELPPTVTLAGGASGSIDNSSGNTINILVSVVPPGGSLTLDYTARVLDTALAGDTIPNTINLTYTSLPGDYGTTSNPTGSQTPGGSGTVNGERSGSGNGLNDYLANTQANFTLAVPSVDKLAPNPSSYTIGESITYDLLVRLPEGTTQDLEVFDDLPAGLAYLPGTLEVITTAMASEGLLSADFNGSLPASSLSTPGGNGGDITLNYSGGVVVPGDNDTSNNSFLVRFQARLLNVLSNQHGNNLVNQASARYTDPESGVVSLPDPTPPTITVEEPILAITKTLVSVLPAPVGVGSVASYQLELAHNGGSSKTAYDVRILDTLPAGLSLNLPASVTLNGGAAGVSDSSLGNVLDITITALPVAGSVTVAYTADLTSDLSPQTINLARLAWSTLLGADPNERSEGDGLPDGNELLDSGALNDYELGDSALLEVAMDFGDMPDFYANTLVSDDGARHILGSLRLGNAITNENEGQESATAGGDSGDDGVILDPAIRWIPGTTVTLSVSVSGASYLAAWFDWNNDGDLSDIGELVEFGAVSAGHNSLALAIPNSAGYNVGQTLFARFRLYESPPASSTPTGLVMNGEVEDYQWNYRPTAVTLLDFQARSQDGLSTVWLWVMALAAGLTWLGIQYQVGRKSDMR